MDPESYMRVTPADIHDRYADLRIIHPQAESAMERSMRLYGQMTPVILGRVEEAYEMVDGFKRLRAARKLGLQTLLAKVIPGNVRAMKAAIIHFNARSHTMADLETGMVIRSLHRQEGLSQVEIAVLLGRHKSFVCRRLRMVEELSEEVIEHLKLGLINLTIGRELSRLPRGNQALALKSVIKYRLNSAETSRLVNRVLSSPSRDHRTMLHLPDEILRDRPPEGPRHCGFTGRLIKMEAYLTALSDAQLGRFRRDTALCMIGRIETALCDIRNRLEAQC